MSIDPKYSELIQADIDGEISATDKAALDAFLAGSEEGRTLHGEFEALDRALDSLGELEPPTHLRHVLLSMAPARAAEATPPGFLARIVSKPALAYAGTFAAGVVLALAVVSSDQISKQAFEDVTGLVGTIADLDNIGPSHSSVAVAKSEVAGTVALRSSGPILILDFDLSARRAIEIVARVSDHAIWFNGFAQLESTGASVAVETGTVKLGMDGERRFAVFLKNPDRRPARIGLEFLVDGELIHEATLDFGE